LRVAGARGKAGHKERDTHHKDFRPQG
jgi:hypothetical protein